MPNVIGIDVGGSRKGFHAVRLRPDHQLDTYQHTEPKKIVDWICREEVAAVAIDAPCGWSQSGGSREAERTLKVDGKHLPCFCTPTRERALTSSFYQWVFNGEALYQACQQAQLTPIETYPHGIATLLLGSNPGGTKIEQRQQALHHAHIPTASLTSPDLLDAALCTLTAHASLAHETHSFGNSKEGYLVLPTEKYFAQRYE
jgi:predicted nuclease with RNAse H fold